MRLIAKTVRDKTPCLMRLEFGLQTLSLIGEVTHHQFGKRLTSPSVGRIMRLLGFTPQKPLYRAWQQELVLAEKWQSEEFPTLKAEAKRPGAVVYFPTKRAYVLTFMPAPPGHRSGGRRL